MRESPRLTQSRAVWRLNRWRRCSRNLQQLSHQLVIISNKCSEQSLEMQRPQSQVQMETLTNFGAAQVAKTTFDAQDFQTKAFAKMKGFTRVSRKLGRIGGTGSALKLRAVSVKRLRPWIGLRTDTINRFLSFPFSLFVFVHVSQFFHISSFLFFKRCLPIFVLE